MDGGILPDLDAFCSARICVKVDLYLCGNVFVFVGENSGSQPGTLVLPRDKLGSDGNTQLGTNWSFVKLRNRKVRLW